ncbi:MAG: hypothetical protein QM579_13275 [Desulfovibrio sp.]|uniref:hypothetical protein n=1 Tax=Desulfovibrio sp. TaxID=885 RepID=UPI0039E5036C
MSSTHKLVLSDSLFTVFEKFRLNGVDTSIDKDVYFNLFSRIKLPHLTNAQQIVRCKDHLPKEVVDDLLPRYLSIAIKDETLEDLSLKTVHRVILSDNKDQVPHANINTAKLNTHYAMTCRTGESRDEMIRHIKHLCCNSKSISLIDKYLYSAIEREVCRFEEILPDSGTEILCYAERCVFSKHKAKKSKTTRAQFRKNFSALQKYFTGLGILQKFRIKTKSYSNIHDRYMLIDCGSYKYKIILSSGFDHLFTTEKEITCIFQECSNFDI